MEDYEVSEVAKILNEWNPLGDEAEYVQDLDGYKTESIDILFHVEMSKGRAGVEKTVMEVLNEAFNIELKRNECSEVATKIFRFLSNKH